MLGDLFVVVKAKLSAFFRGMKDMVGITQGAAKQVNASAKEMENSLNSAFSGQVRSNISNLSENISVTRDNIVQLKEQLKLLLIEQKKQKEGTEEFKKTARAISSVRKSLFEAQQDLAKYNIAARDQKKALADSRLAAEDNSSAMEATSRAVNAASSAILLLSDGNENLKPLLKGVSIAMAGVNAVIAVQNLRLRENAVFLNLVTRSQNFLKVATAGTTVAMRAFKTALLATGIGLFVGAIIGAYEAILDYNKEVDKTIDKEQELYKNREKQGIDSFKSTERAFRSALEFRLLQNEKAGKSETELANLEIDLLKKRREELRNLLGNSKVTQVERAAALELYNKVSDEIYKKELQRDINIIKSNEKVAKSAKKKFKAGDIKQSINDQQKLLIQEVELNKQRLLTTATTELDRAKIINAAEQDVLNIRQKGILQQINAQNLGSNEAKLLFKQLELDRIKITQDGDKRIQDARNKDTDALVKSEEDKQKAIQEANLGLLKLREELYTVLQGINAKQFNDGVKSEKDYIAEQKQLTIDWLKEKIRLQRAAGVDTLKTEQELANALIAQDKSNKKELTKEQQIFARRTSQLFQQAFSKLGQDLVNAINDSLQRAFQGTSESAQLELDILKAQQRELEQTMKDATQSELQMLQNRRQYLENEQKIAEATESNMQKLFKTILTGVADFLEQLGIGLIAAALATEAFQKLLLSNPPAAAAAGGAAILAAAGVRSIIAKGPKFADGGIVSGPTLGLVGEYPGASTNPEVIAPLDKLKSLISGGNGDSGGFVAETRISGRDLAIVLNRYNKDLQRG